MFAIVNKTVRPVLCRFNSGGERSLAPGECIEVSDAEVRGNGWLRKLEGRSLIDLTPLAAGEPPPARRAGGRAAAHRAAGSR